MKKQTKGDQICEKKTQQHKGKKKERKKDQQQQNHDGDKRELCVQKDLTSMNRI